MATVEEEDDEISKRRREECERKARRGEMDPRLEYTFQLLIDGTGLPRHEIMDHVFEGNMLDEINQLFLPHMRNKLMWFYQEVEEPDTSQPGPSSSAADSALLKNVAAAVVRGVVAALPKSTTGTAGPPAPPPMIKRKKLFLTDGWKVPLKGICIYMFRLNTGKQLPEEGFQKDLYCGILDAQRIGLVTSIERIMSHVFMEALAHPSPETDADNDLDSHCPMIKNQLLPGLRSFCSALKVCEEVCDQENIFIDEDNLLSGIKTDEEIKEASKNTELVEKLEERVQNWMKKIMELLMESEQLRRENDTSGPQDELEYWKKRGALFSQLVTQLDSSDVKITLNILQNAHSKLLKQWKETEVKTTYCYNEAKDNAKFIQSMEKCCHSLYLDDPIQMKNCILNLLQTVRLIYTVSQFYNTSERTSALMVKITNQMIETCKQYVTCRNKETIWSQDRQVVRQKLTSCIALNHVYRDTYFVVKNQPFLPDQVSFEFSENYVFGKFDTFCGRLKKILSMFDLVDDYNTLFEQRFEGLLLGEALEEAILEFEEVKKCVAGKQYDYLDHRNQDFERDFNTFIQRTDALRENIGETIENNFESVWESPQGIRFLTRFESVSEKIPLTKLDEKYDRVLKYCEKEVERILKLFKRQKDDPPLPRNFPPVAGRLRWSQSLSAHLCELLDSVSAHPVLKVMPAAQELQKKHQHVADTLNAYDKEITAIWMNQNVWDCDDCLRQKLLAFDSSNRLCVNLDERIPLLIRESECLVKMQAPLPMLARTLLAKREYFGLVADSLYFLLQRFLRTSRRVKLEVRPLFLPQLVRLASTLAPGLKKLCWTDIVEWKSFVDDCDAAVHDFDVLVTRYLIKHHLLFIYIK